MFVGVLAVLSHAATAVQHQVSCCWTNVCTHPLPLAGRALRKCVGVLEPSTHVRWIWCNGGGGVQHQGSCCWTTACTRQLALSGRAPCRFVVANNGWLLNLACGVP